MKCFWILLLGFVILVDGNAQWTQLRIVPTAQNLNAISMTSTVRGFAVGEGGTVRVAEGETVQAGLPSIQWNTLLETAPHNLLDVVAINESLAFAVGENGCVVRIEGTSISRVNIPSSKNLRSVASRGATILAGGEDGAAVVSTDGGTIWHYLATGFDADIVDVLADDEGTWYLAMPDKIATSVNLTTWTLMNFPAGCTQLHKLGTVPRSASLPKAAIVAFGDPWYFGATNDNGVSWHSNFISTPHVNKGRAGVLTSAAISSDGMHVSMSGIDNFLPVAVHIISDDAGLTFHDHAGPLYSRYDLSDQMFASPSRLVGTSMNGLCATYSYLPEKQRWSSPENAGSSMFFQSIDAKDGRVVMCGNGDEAVLTLSPTYPFTDLRTTRSSEGTKSVDVKLLGESTVLWLVDSTKNEFIGTELYTFFFSHIMRSTDNGQTFTRVLMRDDSIALTRMWFVDDSVGIASGYGRRFYTTSDAGATWTQRLTPDTGVYITNASFVNSSNTWQLFCYVAATESYQWYRTTDAGITWTNPEAPFTPFHVSRTASGRLLAVGGESNGVGVQRRDAIAISDDGGATWKTVMNQENPPGPGGLRSVSSIGARCIAVGDMEKV